METKYLIDNPNLRLEMGKSAKLKTKDYSTNNITKKWINLFNSFKQL